MIILYGIKNCDTVKRARTWLEQADIEYYFHDFREQGLNSDTLNQWIQAVGIATLVNRRSTTWRQLPDSDKSLEDEGKISNLILAQPTLIKRPVLANGDRYLVGFDATGYENELKPSA